MSSCLSTLSATLTPVAECSRNQERKKNVKMSVHIRFLTGSVLVSTSDTRKMIW